MIFLRILAQLVDLTVACILLIFSFMFIPPALLSLFPDLPSAVAAVLMLFVYLFLLAVLQVPFFQVGQTLGKAFFGLVVVSTNPGRPLTVDIMFQREIFGKLFSCYLVCIPLLFGNVGGHDKAAETAVEFKKRTGRTRK